MSGTLYIGKDTADAIWNLDGSGNSYSGHEGGSSSRVEESHTTTVNGKQGSTFTKVEFTIEPIDSLQKLLVHQYNAAGERINPEQQSRNPVIL